MKNTTNNQKKKVFNLQDAINNLLAEDDASILAEIPAVFVDEAWGDDESYESKAAPCWRHI